jgi:hypothetical protein
VESFISRIREDAIWNLPILEIIRNNVKEMMKIVFYRFSFLCNLFYKKGSRHYSFHILYTLNRAKFTTKSLTLSLDLSKLDGAVGNTTWNRVCSVELNWFAVHWIELNWFAVNWIELACSEVLIRNASSCKKVLYTLNFKSFIRWHFFY